MLRQCLLCQRWWLLRLMTMRTCSWMKYPTLVSWTGEEKTKKEVLKCSSVGNAVCKEEMMGDITVLTSAYQNMITFYDLRHVVKGKSKADRGGEGANQMGFSKKLVRITILLQRKADSDEDDDEQIRHRAREWTIEDARMNDDTHKTWQMTKTAMWTAEMAGCCSENSGKKMNNEWSTKVKSDCENEKEHARQWQHEAYHCFA